MPKHLPKVAWLSPLPPQRSGIANYSYWLVKALRSHFDIDLYYDKQAPTEAIKREFAVHPLSIFAEHHHSYDEVIYHLGNNSIFHKGIYELAWNFPGTVVLHDYNISAFMHEAFYRQNEEQLYKQALLDGYGDAGHHELQTLAEGRIPDIIKFPMSHAVVNRSRKVIVHHRWVKNQFANNNHIEVIPLLAKLDPLPSPQDIELFKNKFFITPDHFVVSCLGFTNSNKLPALQIDVVKRLIDDGYPVKLIFAGEPAPEIQNLEREIRAGQYGEDIIFTGYQSEIDYFSTIFASDIIINLRNPSMGEASLTLMQALAAARPTIISDVNQYREFPDKVCWKLAHDENQAQVLYAYLKALLSDKDLRAAISRNAARYVKNVLNWDDNIARWTEVIMK